MKGKNDEVAEISINLFGARTALSCVCNTWGKMTHLTLFEIFKNNNNRKNTIHK